MRKLFSVLSFVLLAFTFTYGQAAVDIPISGSDGTATIQMALGLDLTATTCIDPALGESDLPPVPPAGVFDIRFDLQVYGCTGLNGSLKDYRNAPAFPFTGTIQHELDVQRSTPGLTVNINYELPTGAVMTITDAINGLIYTSGPLSGTGTFAISGIGASLNNFWVTMAYTNIGPSGPAPIFTIDPASLDFGSVAIGNNVTLPATVTNTGTGDLHISGLVSSNPQFTFAPAAPVTIPAGGNQVFNVTFTPTAVGLQSATLTFTHDAAGSPTIYNLSGTGYTTAAIFNIAPPSLNFPGVIVGNNSTLQATVTNTGNIDLVISNIISSDPEFTFTPNTYPITIAAGNNQVFDITFAPTSVGPHAATLTFQHNAAGGQNIYNVQGTGIDPGPTFSIDHTSLNFGTVTVGGISNKTVTVTNTGALNTLHITNASIAQAGFTVNPASANIPAGGNQVFTVTFAPTAGGPYSGTLVFTDDAPDSPQNVALTGTGYQPPAVFGLVFQNFIVHHPENASYTETMQLKGVNFGGASINAMQFRLLVNTESDDNTILTFQNIQKGTDIADPTWVLDYNVFRGPITPNGASVDTIFVLLYNIEQNALAPGDYNNLFKVTYRIANLPALTDSSKSSILILHAEASTPIGTSIDIHPSVPDLTVWAKNTVLSIGDVNGDGCLDILDLIKIVDHIVGRDSLVGDEFTRADIAPWQPGTPDPTPDGFVNVQDLSLIQNIILTGVYPDGTTLNQCSFAAMPKVNGDADAKLILYINTEGISALLDSKVDIRGAQIEFGNLSSDPKNLVINTDLGQGFYLKVGDLLRTLMYDRLGNKYIESGQHLLADMPFYITNPKDITIEKVILVDMNRNKIENIEVEINYQSEPPLPYDYVLFQNYPNPFNPTTTVKFEVPQTSNVTVTVYNMLGQAVRTLFAGQVQRGIHSVQWDGMNDSGVKMSSGTYIYRMKAGEFVQSKKMILLK